MMRLLTAMLLAGATPAMAAPADELRALMADHYAWLLRINPVQATALGVRDYDAEIGDPSLATRDRQAGEAAAFLKRLDAIPEAGLSADDRTNRAILRRTLAQQVEENGFPQRTMLFTTYYGWHQGFAGMARNLPFRTRADYESYLTRLEKYPAYNDAALAVTEDAVRGGHVLPCSVLDGYDQTIEGVIAADPTRSRFYEPFRAERPAGIAAADWSALQARAKRLVADRLNPAYAKHLAFYRTRYRPACAKADGISAQKGGAAWYAFKIREMTTTDLSADRIHRIGQAEIRRIGAEMDAVAKGAGFADRAAFIAELRRNPTYYAATPEALMLEAARMAKRVDGKMPHYFATLPRLPYTVDEIPKETAEGTTTAYYNPGSPESGIAGTYYVNTSKLRERPLWELPALTLHEAVPGHHHQIALQQEMEIAPFRRNFVFFTAFTEGWGLYSESLGEAMGLYDTPARKMGQLSYQAWRAARLVVDTGIHAKGWDKARAVAFMRANTALSDANIDAEVNRYISWPGQALGYKLGELKIRELRQKAEQALGARFDLRRFHDAVLLQGSVPLDVLERQVDAWIASQRAA